MNAPARKLDAHIWDREANDHYVEPRWCSERLFQVEPFEGVIWDPACGFGTICESAFAAGYPILASDICDRGYVRGTPSRIADFATLDDPVDNIVTNPPFDAARQFAFHALTLARRKVALIFPVARLNAARWLRDTPLRRVWLLTPRPSMPPGHVIASGEKPGGGKMDYAWLVFERGFAGAPELDWLHRDEGVQA